MALIQNKPLINAGFKTQSEILSISEGERLKSRGISSHQKNIT